MSLRKRIEKSRLLAAVIGGLAGRYMALCEKRIRWQVAGLDDLRAALAEGPVLYITWHETVLLSAQQWPRAEARLSTLYNRSPIGRVTGALHRRMGLHPMEMSRRTSNRAASRTVLKRVREGVSIGIAADGPLGPRRQIGDATLEWARATGIPIFGYAFAVSHGRRLNSWDRMLLPYPRGRGAYVFARFAGTIPRRPSPEETEALREALREFMNDTTARAEGMVSA